MVIHTVVPARNTVKFNISDPFKREMAKHTTNA